MGSVVLALLDIARPRQYLKQVKMLEMNIDTLLQAAEYIERREREAEHGYASSLPTSDQNQIISNKNQRLKNSTKKAHGSSSLEFQAGVDPGLQQHKLYGMLSGQILEGGTRLHFLLMIN